MSRYSIDGQILTDIGDALRIKASGSALTSVDDVGYAIGESAAANNVKQGCYLPVLWPRTKLTIDSVEWLQDKEYVAIHYWDGSKASFLNAWPEDLPATVVHVAGVDDANFRIECHRRSEVNVHYTMIPVDENNELIDLTIKPEDMADRINDMMAVSEDNLVVSGDCGYRFAYSGWDWIINNYGNKITTKDISSCAHMFFQSKLSEIPFEINCKGDAVSMANMFAYSSMTTAPMIHMNKCPASMQAMFENCAYLRSFPEGFAEDWDWTQLESSTSPYSGYQQNLFSGCYSLRNVPTALISHGNTYIGQYYNPYYYSFQNCYTLEEINDLVVPYNAAWSGNAFNNTFKNCNRLRDITFKTKEDGTPFAAPNWKNQMIDLTATGAGDGANFYGQKIFTIEKQLTGDMEAYIDYCENGRNGNHPDAWALFYDWSVYNRKSAVRTINTLPDVSASGATNTIKFNSTAASAAGAEYAMANLSEEEIAVAAAKGWTVTLA